MDATTFQTIREGLGYTRDGIAAKFAVREKTVREWELGRKEIPAGIEDSMNTMVDDFIDHVDSFDTYDEVVPHDRASRAVAWSVLIGN